MSLSVYDFRDIDLLAKLSGLGSATAAELAEEIGMDDGAHAVGSRFAWMRRFGMLDYSDKTKFWTPTHGAARVLESNLRAATMGGLRDAPDEALVEVMAHVTSRWRTGDPMIATMLRREFQFGTARR
jgi:hypothetical protein